MAIRIKLQYSCFVAPNILAPIVAYVLLLYYQIEVDSNSDGLLHYGFSVTRSSNGSYGDFKEASLAEKYYIPLQAGFLVSGKCS